MKRDVLWSQVGEVIYVRQSERKIGKVLWFIEEGIELGSTRLCHEKKKKSWTIMHSWHDRETNRIKSLDFNTTCPLLNNWEMAWEILSAAS